MAGREPYQVATEAAKREQLYKIYETAWLLQQKLVADVVPAIIHNAGLFQRHIASFRPLRPVVIFQREAPHTCITTPPIKSSARLKCPVRKVVFAIQSADQGRVSDPNSGSHSWFTAGIVSRENLEDFLTRVERCPTGDDNEAFLDQERQIFRNDVGCSEYKTNIVEWSVDSENEDERRWVASLQNGDNVVVRAWVQYPGWQNKIRSVSVAIYTAAII